MKIGYYSTKQIVIVLVAAGLFFDLVFVGSGIISSAHNKAEATKLAPEVVVTPSGKHEEKTPSGESEEKSQNIINIQEGQNNNIGDIEKKASDSGDIETEKAMTQDINVKNVIQPGLG